MESGIALLPKELAQVISTGELFKIQADLTPIKSYECKRLSSFIQTNEKDVYNALELLIANTAMNVNVKFNIKPEQAPDIARSIYKKYYFYSIEEIALVLRMGAEGELGKIYDRLSKDMIMDWFATYDLRFREPLVDNTRQQMNNEFERNQDEVLAIPQVSEAIGKIIECIKTDQEEEAKKEENHNAWRERYFNGQAETLKEVSEEEIRQRAKELEIKLKSDQGK